MDVKISILKKTVKIMIGQKKGCPKRHPKICRYLEECLFQSECSYSHKKETAVTNERSDLLEKYKTIRLQQ